MDAPPEGTLVKNQKKLLKLIAVQVCSEQFCTALNPKTRGPGFTWEMFETMCLHTVLNLYDSILSEKDLSGRKKQIQATAQQTVQRYCNDLVGRSGVREWGNSVPQPIGFKAPKEEG